MQIVLSVEPSIYMEEVEVQKFECVCDVTMQQQLSAILSHQLYSQRKVRLNLGGYTTMVMCMKNFVLISNVVRLYTLALSFCNSVTRTVRYTSCESLCT